MMATRARWKLLWERDLPLTCFVCSSAQGTNTVLVALGSGEIHEMNIATFKKVSTIRSERFEDDPRAGNISAKTNAMRLSLQPVGGSVWVG